MEEILKKWEGRPEESRTAVVGDLLDIAKGWEESAYNEETRDDAKTLLIIVDILNTLSNKVSK